MRVGWFVRHEFAAAKHVAHDLEYDPKVQWVFHRRAAWVWFGMFVPVVALGVVSIVDRADALFWAAVLLIFNLLMSCYANFATELDAVAASYAAMRAEDAARNTGGEEKA